MTKKEKAQYRPADELRELLSKTLASHKYQLDCGHHITFQKTLGNNITIYNGTQLKIICAECGY